MTTSADGCRYRTFKNGRIEVCHGTRSILSPFCVDHEAEGNLALRKMNHVYQYTPSVSVPSKAMAKNGAA